MHLSALAAASPSALDAFLRPVPVGNLRDFIRRTPVGKRLQRSHLAGFRPQRLRKDRIAKALGAALREKRGEELASALVDLWISACPAARSISHDTLGREDPFDGEITDLYFERLAAVYSSDTIDFLRRLVPPTAHDAELANGLNGAPPYELEAVEPEASAAEPEPQPETSLAQLPPVFTSVLERDLWMATHVMPTWYRELGLTPVTLSVGGITDRLTFAREAAEALSTQGKFVPAASYLLAAIRQEASTGARARPPDDTAAFLTATCLASGLSEAIPTENLDDVAALGLSSNLPLAAAGMLHAILAVCSAADWIYDALDLSAKTRAKLSEAIDQYLGRKPRIRGQTGMHKVVPALVRERLSSLGRLGDGIAHVARSGTLDRLVRERPEILKAAAGLEAFLDVHDAALLAEFRDLVSDRLTQYSEAADFEADAKFDAFSGTVDDILRMAHELGSEFALCVVDPAVTVAGEIVRRNFEGTARSRYPSIAVGVAKPAAVNAATWTFDVEVRNAGSGDAYDCRVGLHLAGEEHEDSHVIGRLLPGARQLLPASLAAPDDAQVIEVEVDISYRDRTKFREGVDLLKVPRQRSIDWDAAEQGPPPYRIQSIEEPERLKGRNAQLRTLRQGFHASGSFMVTGQKRVGKTSLVRVFLHELASIPSVLPMYVPIGALSAASGSEDLGRLGRDLAERVLEEFETRFGGRPAVEAPSVEEFRDSFNSSFIGFLRRFRRAHPVRIAFALDDFDELPVPLFTGATGRAFFLALRSLIDAGTSFFFVGSERLPSIIEEQAERLNQVNLLRVDYLDRAALAEVAREPAAGVLEWGDDAIHELETWSARNPYFAVLICSHAWDGAIRSRDAMITARDVERAVDVMSESTDRNSYQHFWSDSSATSDEERSHTEERAASVLSSLSEAQPTAQGFARRGVVARNAADLTERDAQLVIDELLVREVLEEHQQEKDLIRIRVPVFALWLKKHPPLGMAKPAPIRRPTRRPVELTPDEVSSVSDGLIYRGTRVTTDMVRQWLAQFGDIEDQRVMLPLLGGIRARGLYTQERFMVALETLDRLVRTRASRGGIPEDLDARGRPRNRFLTHADAVGKSGAAVVRQYRAANMMHESFAGAPGAIVDAIRAFRRPSVLVCVNDFIGTGVSAVEAIRRHILPALAELEADQQVVLVVAAVLAFEDGAEYVRAQLADRAELVVADMYTSSDRAFAPDNPIWTSDEQRRRAREIAHRVGSLLERRHPLGWEQSEGLVVFPDSVPNNTLPILYKHGQRIEGREWMALFPRS